MGITCNASEMNQYILSTFSFRSFDVVALTLRFKHLFRPVTGR